MTLASKSDIKEFADEIRKELGERVEQVILYGSYATDEHVPGSDIDIAVIVNEKKEDDREKLFEIADKYRWEKDLFFSPRVFKKTEFEEKISEGSSFHRNVESEGITV